MWRTQNSFTSTLLPPCLLTTGILEPVDPTPWCRSNSGSLLVLRSVVCDDLPEADIDIDSVRGLSCALRSSGILGVDRYGMLYVQR